MATKISIPLFISCFTTYYTLQHCNAFVQNSTSVVSSEGDVGQKLNLKNNISYKKKISLNSDNNGDSRFERTIHVLRFIPQPESQYCYTPTLYLADPRHSHITTTGIFYILILWVIYCFPHIAYLHESLAYICFESHFSIHQYVPQHRQYLETHRTLLM